MPRDVATRWNSTYDMLVFALEYRAAIDAMSADKTNNLRKFELSEGEWTIMKQLYNVLKVSVTVSHLSPPPPSLSYRHVFEQVLKDATLFFSRSTSNLAMVIPAMDVIKKQFTAALTDRNLDPAIEVSIRTARKTLNRYYSPKNSSEVYYIAMSMFTFYNQLIFSNYLRSMSASPPTQITLLQRSRLGRRMDQDGRRYASNEVYALVRTTGG